MGIARIARSTVLRTALAVFATTAAFAGILAVHNSAQKLIQNYNAENNYNSGLISSPLATLSDVTINSREHGHELGRFYAGTVEIGRDVRMVTIANASGVVPIMGQPKSRLRFSCGQAQYWTGAIGPRTGILELTRGLTADVTSELGPVQIAASGMRWDGGAQMANVIGAVRASVGNLGRATCQTMFLDLRNKAIVFGAVQIVAAGSALQATAAGAPATQTAPTTKPADASTDEIHFFAPQGGRDDEKAKMLHIAGPVTITQGDVTLKTVGVDFDHTTKIAHALSAVTIVDGANSLKGDGGDVNFKTHVANVTGHVDIYAVPKEGETPKDDELDAQARQPTHLHCDHILYNYRTKLADADGHLVVLQTSRQVTATTAHYDTVAQIITLTGDVDAKSKDGKHLAAPDATVSVNPDDEWIEIKGPISASFSVDDNDNPLPPAARGKQNKKGSAPTPSPAPAPSASPQPTPSP